MAVGEGGVTESAAAAAADVVVAVAVAVGELHEATNAENGLAEDDWRPVYGDESISAMTSSLTGAKLSEVDQSWLGPTAG